ncbi:MAG: flagellar filament capping protein FliD [candidate division KSB1 bacterium]|nr:flagellar filament capping protein FliD [candidate division KSB1 bacterium]
MLTQGVSFGGLISGLDTQRIIEQLMAIERRPVDLLTRRQNQYEDLLSAWREVNSKLLSLRSAAESLLEAQDFGLFKASSEDEDLVSVSASSSARPESHTVRVLSLAQAQKLSSRIFEAANEALGYAGEILVNGVAVSIAESYSLLDIRDAINAADVGVTASVVKVAEGAFRLILAANETGSSGFALLDASSTNILQSLGFSTGVERVKNEIDAGGAATDYFASRSASIQALLGMTRAPSGTIRINGVAIEVDLATDTLESLKAKIDAAGIPGVTTSITSTTVEGEVRYRLEIQGASAWEDSDNVLEALGVLQADFSQGSQQVLTGSVANRGADGLTPITASTRWSEIYGANVQVGDTITVIGTDHEGNRVSGVYTISDTGETLQNFLTYLETLFGGKITAGIDATGRLTITDKQVGESRLSIRLTENNEGGGNLNFGTLKVSAYGYSIQLAAGQDAEFEIDGVRLVRSTNVVTDAIDGLTLTLHKADEETPVNISVTRDLDAVKQRIRDFANRYNEIVSYINEQFTYNPETQKAGTLFGDATLRTIQSTIRRVLVESVKGLPSNLNALAQIGISTDRHGLIQIDDAKLTKALEEDFEGVVRLFIGRGSASDSDIQVLSFDKYTKPGTYDVVITQAATRASVVGSVDLTSGLMTDTVLTIQDCHTGWAATIQLRAGENIDTIVSRINEELAREYNQQLSSSVAKTAGGSPIRTSTLLVDVDTGADPALAEGDVITISGWNHDGSSVYGTFTVTATSTVQDLLRKIQDAFAGKVVASLDAEGHILIEDTVAGTSSTSLTLVRTHGGEQFQDFGSFSVRVPGRYSLGITASNENGHLKLVHNSYGSLNGFSVVEGSGQLGIAEGTYTGQDVTGTINGETATGRGRVLTGNSDQTNIAGLAILVKLTPEQLLAQGENQGTVTVTKGVAQQMKDLLDFITDSYTGYVAERQEVLQQIIDNIQERIDIWEDRLALRRVQLENRFTQLERMLATLNSLGSYLGSQLGSISRLR